VCTAQDEVNQEDSEQNEADGMKKGADSIIKPPTTITTCYDS